MTLSKLTVRPATLAIAAALCCIVPMAHSRSGPELIPGPQHTDPCDFKEQLLQVQSMDIVSRSVSVAATRHRLLADWLSHRRAHELAASPEEAELARSGRLRGTRRVGG